MTNVKSTVEEIRQRFDNDVERFSNLETGQSAAIDAPLVMNLIVQAAAAVTPRATHALDVGCGAGNYALSLLTALPNLNIDLNNLSQPMLDRAEERMSIATRGSVITLAGDIRTIVLDTERYDIIVAAASLHHLRDDAEWEQVFRKLYNVLKPGGSLWISDLIEHSHAGINALMWHRYGDYLTTLKDEAYRDHVFDYIEKEDTPRPLMYQLDMLRLVGFGEIDVLHKNSTFAAFGGIK